MKDTVFFIQYHSMGSSSRGILSGGVVLDMDDLLDTEYLKQALKPNGTLLYATGRQPLKDIKSMRLDEFEQIFSGYTDRKIDHLLGWDGSECVFRKEIQKKYGRSMEKPKVPCTLLYPENCRVVTDRGKDLIYLGNFESFTVQGKTFCGYFYCPVEAVKDETAFQAFLTTAYTRPARFGKHFTKSKRRAQADGCCPVTTFLQDSPFDLLYLSYYEKTKLHVEYVRKQAA